MPTITDAINEKIVRRDMLFSHSCQKTHPLVAGLDDFGTSRAGEPQPAAERCALCRCLVDLDQHGRLGTACIATIQQILVGRFDHERNDQIQVHNSGRWIDQFLMHDAMVREKIDEAADLRRQMMAMRINRVRRTFHRPVIRQDTNQTTGSEIVGDQESRGQRNADPLQGGQPQRLATIGGQIAGDPDRRRRVIRIEEMPVIAKGIKYVAKAIMVCEFG
jgi:hypothetical protein